MYYQIANAVKWPASLNEIAHHQGYVRLKRFWEEGVYQIDRTLNRLEATYDINKYTFCLCQYFSLKRMIKSATRDYQLLKGLYSINEVTYQTTEPTVDSEDVDYELYESKLYIS